MSPEAPGALRRYLESHRELHLATQGPDGPHVAPVFYVLLPDDLHLAWVSHPATYHSRLLASEARVAGSVPHPGARLGPVRGLQLRGRACCPSALQRRLQAAYLWRFPETAPLLLTSSGYRFFLLEVDWARLVHWRAGTKQNLEWARDLTQGVPPPETSPRLGRPPPLDEFP